MPPMPGQVDLFDNYGSHWPIFLFFISAVQVACFAYYVLVLMDSDEVQASRAFCHSLPAHQLNASLSLFEHSRNREWPSLG